MKIAIVSEDGLPDIRVEKMINTLSKIASEIHYIGEYYGLTGLPLKAKPVIHRVKWGRPVNLHLPPHYGSAAEKVKELLNEVKPDLVVAVNLVAARIVEKSGYNMIIDYHEVYSETLKHVETYNPLRLITNRLRRRIYPRLEEELLPKHPFITISSEAGRLFEEKYGAGEYIVVRNYPSVLEAPEKIDWTEYCGNGRKIYYIGKDLLVYDGRKYRDMRNTRSILEKLYRSRGGFEVYIAGVRNGFSEPFYPLGRLPHIELYKYTGMMHFGLITYAPHPLHRLFSPNKVYIYAYMGAIPIITETLKEPVNDLDGLAVVVNAEGFNEDLEEKLGDLLSMDCDSLLQWSKKLVRYARARLAWERLEHKILRFIQRHT